MESGEMATVASWEPLVMVLKQLRPEVLSPDSVVSPMPSRQEACQQMPANAGAAEMNGQKKAARTGRLAWWR
jgi:hypothetical protein